ncbi:MAG: TetR/AcrR family transcriptional regulator [Desulfobacterales bacterium]|jgi:AcrR family transcriptional regulator
MFNGLKPEVQARLEAAVLEIFSNSDFHKATMRDVAQKAGISFSTIYTCFGSKEKLVFAFVDIYMGKLTERIIDHLQGIEDLKEKLRKVLWLQLDYYERHDKFGRIVFMTLPMKTWIADETFEQKKMFDLFMDVLSQGQQEGILNAEVPTSVLLDFMMGFVQRSFFMWVARGAKYSLSADANTLFDIIWRGISQNEPAG